MKQLVRRCVAHAVARLPIGILAGLEHVDIFQKAGVHITRDHFYQPIPNTDQIRPDLWERPSPMLGVDRKIEQQRDLIEEVSAAGFLREYHDLPEQAEQGAYSRSGGFGGADGAILYSMIRKLRPRRMIEIGAGQSTLLSAHALGINGGGHLTSIDPFPPNYLPEQDDSFNLIRGKVEDIPFSMFEALEANDILFIDSSHIVKIGGDVIHEVLEILPRLKLGVHIHIHDIYLPRHYWRRWVVDERRFWAEQYLVQAFLAFNTSFEITWSFGILASDRPDLLVSYFPDCKPDAWDGGSLWLKRAR